MRSQPKKLHLLKPDAAPRGDSSYVFILIKRSTLPNGADSIHAPHITRICDFIYEGFSSFNPGFLSMADQLRPVIVVCVYCVCAMCRVQCCPRHHTGHITMYIVYSAPPPLPRPQLGQQQLASEQISGAAKLQDWAVDEIWHFGTIFREGPHNSLLKASLLWPYPNIVKTFLDSSSKEQCGGVQGEGCPSTAPARAPAGRRQGRPSHHRPPRPAPGHRHDGEVGADQGLEIYNIFFQIFSPIIIGAGMTLAILLLS